MSVCEGYELLRGEVTVSKTLKEKGLKMKQFLAAVVVLSLFLLGMVGCAEKATVTKETKVSTPGGTTKVAVEREVKHTGDNPPAAQR